MTNNELLTEIAKDIREKIAEYDEFEKKSSERGNINMTLSYINQKSGLYEALNIINGKIK